MLQPNDYPISVHFDRMTGVIDPCPTFIERRVSHMQMMFHDQAASAALIAAGDPLVYEIRQYPYITSKSDMALAVTNILPGKVGDEYHMTKGHQHEADNQPEIYHCMRGRGYLLLDTLQGEFQAVPWEPGVITHIPPQWAHRVVNTGDEPLIFTGSFHVAAGHDYAIVERLGFQKIVVERDGKPALVPVR